MSSIQKGERSKRAHVIRMHPDERHQTDCRDYFRQVFQCGQHSDDRPQRNNPRIFQPCPQHDSQLMRVKCIVSRNWQKIELARPC